MDANPVLDVDNIYKSFRRSGGVGGRLGSVVEAVRGVSFQLATGETLGIVGETGCGKSTVARCVAGLTPVSRGSVRVDGTDLAALDRKGRREIRKRVQIVFQNPFLSLDPRMSVVDIVTEPLRIHKLGSRAECRQVACATLASVGIGQSELDARPAHLSGGQRQRVAIARALVLDPAVLILDEPVSSLDVSIQAQVLNLLLDLQQQRRVSYLVILHDLAVATQMCDRIAVIYLGEIVDEGAVRDVLTRPRHPYSQALLAAVPHLGEPVGGGQGERLIGGDATLAAMDMTGCRFRSRCQLGRGREICAEVKPPLRLLENGERVACHFAGS